MIPSFIGSEIIVYDLRHSSVFLQTIMENWFFEFPENKKTPYLQFERYGVYRHALTCAMKIKTPISKHKITFPEFFSGIQSFFPSPSLPSKIS